MDEVADQSERLSLRFAVFLAAGLLVTVVALNLLGTPEIPISEDQLQRLQKDKAIERLKIAPGGWHIQFSRPCRIENGGGEFISKQAVLSGAGEPDAAHVAAWRAQGIALEWVDDPPERAGWAGGVLVAGLLGLGIWHLVQQMQRHRREGSPRQHLDALEKEYKEGRMSQADFQRRAEELMAQM